MDCYLTVTVFDYDYEGDVDTTITSSFASTANKFTVFTPAARSNPACCLDMRSNGFKLTIMTMSRIAPRSYGSFVGET